MKKEWKAFRITFLLYVGVLILPFIMYWNYTLFSEVRSTQDTLEDLNAITKNIVKKMAYADEVDFSKNTKEWRINLEKWVQEHESDPFYVGGGSILLRVSGLQECWELLDTKEIVNKQTYSVCLNRMESFTFTINKMMALSLANLQNLIYLSLTALMLIFLMLIFFIRLYIEYQLKQNAIYDFETKLFNKKYFAASIRAKCATAMRHDRALTVSHIRFKNLDKLDKQKKAHVLHVLGGIFESQCRESDIVCRYSENIISAILADTALEGAHIYEQRIKGALNSNSLIKSFDLVCSFVHSPYQSGMSCESFVKQVDEDADAK